jgi:uncharacterized membrane protein YeiB
MNNQNPTPPSDPNMWAPAHHDWREERRAQRRARHEARWQMRAEWPFGWIGGVILILLGVTFLLEEMGIPFPPNLWALAILIPAFGAYVAFADSYQRNGHMTRSGARSLTIGILLSILALVLFLNVDVGLFWPVLLILGGLILVGTALLPE